jgi:hypothetical protein
VRVPRGRLDHYLRVYPKPPKTASTSRTMIRTSSQVGMSLLLVDEPEGSLTDSLPVLR